MLLSFPYYGNYVDLTRLELQTLLAVGPSRPVCKYAFIGSGPLPLTSLCILEDSKSQPGQRVTCCNIDKDAEALCLASRLSHKLGYSDKEVDFRCADVSKDPIDLGQFDIVYLAALVGGCDQGKHRILAGVVRQMKAGAMLVLRSSHSLRRLLYQVSLYKALQT